MNHNSHKSGIEYATDGQPACRSVAVCTVGWVDGPSAMLGCRYTQLPLRVTSQQLSIWNEQPSIREHHARDLTNRAFEGYLKSVKEGERGCVHARGQGRVLLLLGKEETPRK